MNAQSAVPSGVLISTSVSVSFISLAEAVPAAASPAATDTTKSRRGSDSFSSFSFSFAMFDPPRDSLAPGSPEWRYCGISRGGILIEMLGRGWIALVCLALAAQPAGTLTEQYREVASKLIDAAMVDEGGMEKLSYLCDRIGNRLSGSVGLEKAIAWAAAQMNHDGLVNVATPRVKVPHWVRGNESAALMEPVSKQLTMLGLGGSVATPKKGITADVIPVSSFEDLERKGKPAIDAKIVLFNVPYESYGRTVLYRTAGASRAARLGAIAVLVRSITPISLQSPHTGAVEYQEGAPKIPAAAVTIEDALMIQRLVDAGNTVTVHLEMEAHMLPDAESANVIGEIPGRERPDEVVVIGGHIDSWDVGAGAQDDGTGIITALEAAHLIHQLGLRPRRTLRVVFWTNEENGG